MTFDEWAKSKIKLPKGAKGKSLDRYIDRVYEANKVVIDEKFNILKATALYHSGDNKLSAKKWFRDLVKGNMSAGDDWAAIIKKWGNTNAFTTEEERLTINTVKKIRQNESIFREFRRKIGWNNAIHYERFKFEGRDTGGYRYSYGDVTILVKLSPYEVVII